MEAAAGPHTDDEERGRERHPSISEVDLKANGEHDEQEGGAA